MKFYCFTSVVKESIFHVGRSNYPDLPRLITHSLLRKISSFGSSARSKWLTPRSTANGPMLAVKKPPAQGVNSMCTGIELNPGTSRATHSPLDSGSEVI